MNYAQPNATFTLGSWRSRGQVSGNRGETEWARGDAGRPDAQTWEAVIAVTAVPDFKTINKFAMVRIRNIAGLSKTGWTEQNVTVLNKP